MSDQKPEDAQSDGPRVGTTVGSLGLGTAGMLEIGRSSGILGVGLWVLWQAINGDLTAIREQVTGVSGQVVGLSVEVKTLSGDLQDLRNDVTRLQVQADLREKRPSDK